MGYHRNIVSGQVFEELYCLKVIDCSKLTHEFWTIHLELYLE
jgi:hypothetical protein